MWIRKCGRAVVLAAILVGYCISLTSCSRGSPDKKAVDKCFTNLPPHWAIAESFFVSADETRAIQEKLGVPIERLSNTVLVVHGQQIQVNLLDCPSENDAKKLHDVISGMKGHPAFCLRRDKRVIEFVGDSIQLAIKTSHELGFIPKPTEARFRVTAELVPIDECDYMSANELFNLFLRVRNDPGDQVAKSRIVELSKRFRFGREIQLRTSMGDGARPACRFTPEPGGKHAAGHGETVTYTFKDTPDWLGVPYVSLVAEIKTRNDGLTATSREEARELLAATEFWPVNAPEIIRLAQEITKELEGREAKVEAILRWLTPGRNVQFGGVVEGSRWGVKKVLEQGYGQCWDFADCFVTLCRAVGIPCRQIGGWLYGATGHIWAEVLLQGKGWQQVDPTGGAAMKCGIYHIPYFTSEDGHMPILYTALPEIDILTEGRPARQDASADPPKADR